ncbi:MAG TPA: efflux RND transporter periplasmic adaptor subunit, partial [Burkholderiaceae bacterium]
QADAQVGEIRATIDRKTIRAPFAGTLGIRLINRGQYLAGGSPIVSLQSLQPVYVNFSVPQQDVSRIARGTTVQASSDSGVEAGTIAAIDSIIDEATRNARVQAIFRNAEGKLRPGMFVQAQLASGASKDVIALPASAISYAPFGDSVFIVEMVKSPDGKSTYRGVRQQFVKLGGSRGDQVAVLTGIKEGDMVATSGQLKLKNCTPVVIDNKVTPKNDVNPTPQEH